MKKYTEEAKEKAYEFFKIQGLSFLKVIEKMREEYPTFSKGTLTKWKNDPELDWNGRHRKFCQALAVKRDEERLKQFKPILRTIQDIREKVYDQLITALGKGEVVNDKNIVYVLSSFVKMAEMESKLTGGGKTVTPVIEVVMVILTVLERDPHFGPLLKTHKNTIEDAIFEEIKGG